MDVRYINPFIKSLCNTFETMCATKIAMGKPTLKGDSEIDTDVSAIIGFSGDAAGSVMLGFKFDVASKIATKFAGTEITRDHPDFADALGELANMVAGGAKAQFEGLSVDISLPSVVIGENHHVPNSRNAPRVLITCTTDVGAFHVEIGMIVSKKPSPSVSATQTAGAHA